MRAAFRYETVAFRISEVYLAPTYRNGTVSFHLPAAEGDPPAMPPSHSAPDPRRWWGLAVLCLSLITISVDNTILNVALPTLASELDASASQLQWIVDAYMLVFAGLLLTAGALGDRFGRRRALAFGLATFGVGSLLAALAPGSGELIAARALMGVGGAFIMPSTLSILTATFPPRELGKAIGIWSGFAGIGIAIGPVSGGWLLEHFAWNSIFLVNLPIVAVALVAGHLLLHESKDPAGAALDPRGFVLSAVGLTALVWSIIEAPTRGWTDGLTLGAFALAIVTLTSFVAWELRAPSPMLDVRLFRNRRFSASSIAISLAFFALFGVIFFLTQYLQAVLGYSALEAGLRTLPVAAGLVIGGPLSHRLTAAAGTKLVVASGLATIAAALLLLTRADVDSGYGLVAAAQVLLGFGMAIAMAPATEAIMGSLPLAKASVGSAVNDATRTTGGALGVAVLGSLLSSGYRAGMDSVTSALPDSAAAAAHDSIGGALAVAARIGGPAGEHVADAARTAFVSGMHSALLVGAAVALAGAIVALRWLPARAAEESAAPAAAVAA
jgi:EmrB/QacA subfamily drug resistance transporter